MDPATMALIASIVNAGASTLSGMSSGGQTQGQKRDQNTISDILNSLQGGGKYGDMFSSDYDAFKTSYVDPAMSRFKNIIAPGIQQEYIASGQQRGTGLDDSLARAGVDLQSDINKQYAGFQDSAMDRKFRALQGTLGQGQAGQQSGNKFGQALGGFASSGGGQELMSQILNMFSQGNQNNINTGENKNTTYGYNKENSPNPYYRG